MDDHFTRMNGGDVRDARAGSKPSSDVHAEDSNSNPANTKSNHSPNMNDKEGHESTKENPKTSSEINPASANGDSLREDVPNGHDAETTVESKQVSTANLGEDETGGDPGIERILPAGGDQDDAEDDKDPNTQMEMGTKKKKKKKSKSKSKRGLIAPTGFEEYYVDAPLTPAEFEEEQSMYDSSFPFAQRIEKAVQRFVAKRNLDSERKKIFDRYLINGGVEAGPKMFSGGLDNKALSDMNAAEIAEQTATNYVGDDRGEPGDPVWVVDFEGCLKSFLSSQFAAQWEITSHEKLKYLVNIIRNFLNYLLHHDVCPEYKDQIDASRVICDKAEKELWAITQVNPLLPGDFNMACSEIFGGKYQGMYTENQAWMEGLDIDYQCGISPKRAREVFKVGLAANATDQIFQEYSKQLHDKTWRIASVESTSFEITEVVSATNLTQGLYAQDQYSDLKIVGKVKAQTWLSPKKDDEDLTEEEEAAALAGPAPEIKLYEFWMEEELLQNLFVGMKFDAKVTQLSFGVSYFDAINGVFCSFYQVLPNELMAGWREPEKEWLPMKQKNMLAQSTREGFEDYEEPDTEDMVDLNEGAETKHSDDRDNAQKTEDFVDKKPSNKGLNVESEAVKDASNGLKEGSDGIHGVEVHEAGGKYIDVPGNSEKVFEKTFNVEAHK